MPIPEQRDLDDAREVLARLARATSSRRDRRRGLGRSRARRSPGFSNETLLFDATWTEGGTAATARARRAGEADRAHGVPRVRLRVAVPGAASARSSTPTCPLPPVRWFEADASFLGAPFFVMGKVDGRVPGRQPAVHGGRLAPRRGHARAAAHARRERPRRDGSGSTPPTGARSVSTSSTSRSTARPASSSRSATTRRSFEWAAAGPAQPVADAALEWVQANRRRRREDSRCAGATPASTTRSSTTDGNVRRGASTGRW